MKTTRSFDLKVLKLTSSVNAISKQVSGKRAWAGFKGTAEYKDTGLTTAQLAAVLNYGSPHNNLPPRPFMEKAITGSAGARINKIIKKHLEELFREELISQKIEFAPAGLNPRYQKRAVKALMDDLSKTMYNNILSAINNAYFAPLSEPYRHYTGKSKFLDKSDDFIAQITHGTD